MRRALELADIAAAAGDVPVGAVVLGPAAQESGVLEPRHGGEVTGGAESGATHDFAILGEGFNRRDARADPLAHAEVLAMQQAAQKLGTWNLQECTLVVTLEPCPMCAGAAVMAHVGRIVFGAWDAKLGACGSVWDIPRDPHVGFTPEVIGGVMESECTATLRNFFENRRVK